MLNERDQRLMTAIQARQNAMVVKLKKTNKQTRETDLHQMQARIAESAATSLSALETSLDTTMQTMTTIDQCVMDRLDVLTSQVDGLLDIASA